MANKKKQRAKPKRKPAKKAPSKKAGAKKKPSVKRWRRGRSETVDTVNFQAAGVGPRSGGQSGDLQGLSNREGADAESVDELLEEGNAFEAEAVKGVEDAPEEQEVRTREVPEDDVPDEYRDNGRERDR